MANEFSGTALPLDEEGINDITDLMSIKAQELWAVIAVETGGCGFQADRRPVILFERHIFSRETRGNFDGSHSDISNSKAGGYGERGAAQYKRLSRALDLDRKAALRSTSWGIGQVMGFNAKTTGFPDAEAMVEAMAKSETEQLRAMAKFIMDSRLDKPLRSHDWVQFARGYNGKDFAKNKYDVKLAEAFHKYSSGLLPDILVRTAQVYLSYLGFKPGSIDGIFGKFTKSALNEFQAQEGLPETNTVNKKIVSILKDKVLNNG